MKNRSPSFPKKVAEKNRERWVVYYFDTEKQKRWARRFSTQAEALEFFREKNIYDEKLGVEANRISQNDRRELVEAKMLFSPLRVSLTNAALTYVKLTKDLEAHGISLSQAIEEYKSFAKLKDVPQGWTSPSTNIGSGFLGRFLYCKGAPKTILDSKEIIPLDESAILKWETLLAQTYQTRKKGLPVWFDTDQDAFEYFWDFDAFNTHLMNGKLRTQASLLGKARENAIRLAVIFAQAEGADRITANIAKRACRVVSYSICVSVVLFSSGMLPEIEYDRAKMDAMIRQNDGFYKKISFFDQYSSLRSERVEFIVHTFPDLYEIVKKGKGRYVVLKDRLPDAKQALGIEINDDDVLF